MNVYYQRNIACIIELKNHNLLDKQEHFHHTQNALIIF